MLLIELNDINIAHKLLMPQLSNGGWMPTIGSKPVAMNMFVET